MKRVLFVQNYTASLSSLLGNVSTALYSQQLTQEDKVTKIQMRTIPETMKLLAKSYYGYQIMERSRHTLMMYLSDEKTQAAINIKLFKKLHHVDNYLNEIQLAKAQIEQKEPIYVGFFIPRYAILRMLELQYIFCAKIGDVNKLEELETDTEYVYLAIAEKELEEIIPAEMNAEWEQLRSTAWSDNFSAGVDRKFLPRTYGVKEKKNDKREHGLCKEQFKSTEMLCCCSKTYCCYNVSSNKFKFSSKLLNRRVLKHRSAEPGKIVSLSRIKKQIVRQQAKFPEQTITLLLHANILKNTCYAFTHEEL